jgi:hypothetical protein
MPCRYRSLAGACVRAIRIDVQLSCAHYIAALSSVSHVVEEEDVGEVHPAIGELTRAASRAAEECSPYLPPRKHTYAFGCVAGTGAPEGRVDEVRHGWTVLLGGRAQLNL